MIRADKIKGIFASVTDRKDSNPNNPDQQKIVGMVQQDFEVFKEARQTMDDIWQREYRFYMGDHWYGLRTDEVSKYRPNSVDNVAWSQTEAIVAKLAGWMPIPDFEPQEEQDEAKALQLNDYVPYELRRINFKQKYLRAIRKMVIHGTLLLKTYFDPTVEGGKGLNRWIGRNDIVPLDLPSFFPDPRIRDFIDLQDMSAIIVKTVQTLEYFRERFGEQGKKVESDIQSDTEIYDHIGDGNAYSNQQTSSLIEYWYRGTPKMMTTEDRQIFTEMAAEQLSNGIDPSEAIAKSDGKMDGVHCIYISSSGVFLEHKSYVYDHGQYPFVARTLFPDDKTAWGKGFMRDMMKPQIMLNKFAEIAVETMAKMGNGAIMYEDGAITKPRTWKEQRSSSGAMLPVAQGRMNDVKELQGVNVPNTVFNMLEYYKDMLQKIPGQFDSSVGQPNASVTSGEQAKALIAAASTRLNVVSETVQEALEEVFTQYIQLMAQFYTTERVARITGRTVGVSRDTILSTVPTIYETGETITDPATGQEIPEQIQVYEQYVPEFDIVVNIGVDKPNDREYYIQLAFNLLPLTDPLTGLPMVDAEAVRYTVQNGRMEPMDTIQQRIEEKAGLQQQIQQMQQQMMMLQQENEQMSQTFMQLQQQAV